jgi:hypothetical protein
MPFTHTIYTSLAFSSSLKLSQHLSIFCVSKTEALAFIHNMSENKENEMVFSRNRKLYSLFINQEKASSDRQKALELPILTSRSAQLSILPLYSNILALPLPHVLVLLSKCYARTTKRQCP